MPASVLLVDDHPVVRHALRTALEDNVSCSIAGEASTGREALDKAKELQPDIVILDLGLPEIDGIEVIRQTLRFAPLTRILVFTFHAEQSLIADCVKAGAAGYLLKSVSLDELRRAVAALIEGHEYFESPEVRVVQERVRRDQGGAFVSRLAQLSRRESDVLRLLADGCSNRSIATRLQISVRTVENHRAKILDKLGAGSLAEVVRIAIRGHAIEP